MGNQWKPLLAFGLNFPRLDQSHLFLMNLYPTSAALVNILSSGNIGEALINYTGFEKHNIKIAAVFDIDPQTLLEMTGAIKLKVTGE